MKYFRCLNSHRFFNNERTDSLEKIPKEVLFSGLCLLVSIWGWDGWMASLTQWTWVWVNSGSWWWTGRPGVLQFMARVAKSLWLNWLTDWGAGGDTRPAEMHGLDWGFQFYSPSAHETTTGEIYCVSHQRHRADLCTEGVQAQWSQLI